MISDNKVGKYILYAIGEIFLVVVGILIAFQLDNWNTERQGQNRKTALLHSLKNEFKQNLNQLADILYYDSLVVASSFEAYNLSIDDPLINNKEYMDQLIQNTSWSWTFDPQNGALRSGISSGDINYIKNDSLLNCLFSWQDVVLDAKENELWAYDARKNAQELLEKYIRYVEYRSTDRKEFHGSKFPSDYKGLLNDPLFEDYITIRYNNMAEAVLELKIVRDLNINILRLIDQELEKSN